jgi:two-component system, OmpR family, response regulator RstA
MKTSAHSPASTLLLVADDPRAAARIGDSLQAHNLAVTVHPAAKGAAQTILRAQPDAVILALSLPMADLLAICRKVRPGYANPILILTDGAREEDELAILRAGACRNRVELPQITVDAGRRAARVHRRWIDLSTAEFEVLWLLARRAGRTVPRDEICSRVRGFSYNGLDRTIDLRIARLRKKLGDDGRHPTLIKSVRGEGYMLVREA